MGSVHYLPPEQANGKGCTVKSDIYSMGILMYELITGSIPYKGDNAVEIALKHLKEPLPSIRKKLPNIPQSIENIIIKATAKNPKNRYKDAREMHQDIVTALDPSKANEPKYVYKYSENDVEETKILNDTIKEVEKKVKEEKVKEKKKLEVEEKEESKKQNKLLIILGSIFTGLVLVTTVILLIYFNKSEVKQVVIPDVSAKTIVDASNILVEQGFKVTEDYKYVSSDEIENGYVVKTYPEIGRKVVQGKEIILYISSGPETFALEDYVGQNYLQVQTKLETMYGCNILIEYTTLDEEKFNDLTSEEEVLKTNPEAGTKIKKGATITLYIPELKVEYPDFSDGSYTLSDIEEFCQKNEITLKVDYELDDSVAEGTILKQSRPKNTIVVPGITFTITVSYKSEPSTLEDDTTDEDEE